VSGGFVIAVFPSFDGGFTQSERQGREGSDKPVGGVNLCAKAEIQKKQLVSFQGAIGKVTSAKPVVNGILPGGAFCHNLFQIKRNSL
jgi:hypothetical protein